MSKLKLIAIVALIAGPVVAFMGYQERQRVGKIEAEGIEVLGVPVGGNMKKGRKGSKSYLLEVEYPDGKGGTRNGEFKVTGAFFETITDGNSITADTVPVKMLAEDPSQAIVVGGSTDDRMMFPFGIGAFVIGGIGTAFMFRKKRVA